MARLTASHEEIPALPWQECFAKTTEDGRPGLSVLEHCRNVGEVARALLSEIPPPVVPLLGGNPGCVAALHDIGKVSPGFQLKYFSDSLRTRLPELARHAVEGYCTRHAEISEAALLAFLAGDSAAPGIAAVAGIHHGRREGAKTDEAGTYGGASWASQRRNFIERLCEVFGPLPHGAAFNADVLAGFVCAADWIGSDERFFPPTGLPGEMDLSDHAQRAVADCGWVRSKLNPGLTFEEVFRFQPYPLQQEFIDRVERPGLYVLEAPMGSGKTEAALYAAYRLMMRGANSGLYFGLPTRLTSDKIHERVEAFLAKIASEGTATRLAHGNAWLRAFEHGGEGLAAGREWFSPSKRALLEPFAVGTIDQALLSVAKVKHFFVRSFGLAGKVVILDEVHSYDLYTGTLLDLLVRRLLEMNCTVIVLSATLTRERRYTLLPRLPADKDESYPQATIAVGEELHRYGLSEPAGLSITAETRVADDADVAQRAVERASAGQCVVCIANTVAAAQRWYNEVKAAMPEGAFPAGLLHSKFPGWRREELESRWTTALGKEGPRPNGCVLVATQVVEQSVDLDADFMITELAPTDMLLQRLGRLWRHPRAPRPCDGPRVLIVTRDLDGAGSFDELVAALGKSNSRVYAPYVLWRTFQVWKDMDGLRVPDDIPALLDRTYSQLSDSPGFVKEARRKLETRKEKLRAMANAARADVLGFPTMDDEESVATRYSDLPTLEAVLATSVSSSGYRATIMLSNGAKISPPANGWVPRFAAALLRNVVSLPRYLLPAAKRPPFLRKYFYDERTPILLIDDSGELTCDGQGTGLRYDDERGLQVAKTQGSRAQQSRDFDYDAEEEFDELDS